MNIADTIHEIIYSCKCGAEDTLDNVEKALDALDNKSDRFRAEEILNNFKMYIKTLQVGADYCDELLNSYDN